MNNNPPKNLNNGSIYTKAFNSLPNNGRTNRINSLPNGNTSYDHNTRNYTSNVPFNRMASTVWPQFSNNDSTVRLYIKEAEDEQ